MNRRTQAQMRAAICCASGKHRWTDPEDRARCCNGWQRVQGTTRQELEAIGA